MEVKDQATAIEAALNLDKPATAPVLKPGEPPAPRKLSTSEKLFPENVSPDGFITNRPVKAYSDTGKELPPAGVTPTPAPAAPAPILQAPTAPGELDLSKLPDGTMVRIKVDGVEMTVSAKEALKNIQLERHLTQRSQELARERASLEADRAALRQPPAPVKAPEAPAIPPAPGKAPAEDPRIATLERQLAELNAIVGPQKFQSGLNRLAERAKTELGATDFMEYSGRIKEIFDAEVAKPEVAANPALMARYDNPETWYSKYQELKLKDVLSGARPAAPVLTLSSIVQPPPMEAPAGTHIVLDKNNRPVIVPVLEGADSVPSRVSQDQDWQTRYATAMATAQRTGRTEDWQTVFRLKREPQQS